MVHITNNPYAIIVAVILFAYSTAFAIFSLHYNLVWGVAGGLFYIALATTYLVIIMRKHINEKTLRSASRIR